MNRRGFVGALVAGPLVAWVGTSLANAAQFGGTPGQQSQQFPNGMPITSPEPKLHPHAVLKQYEKEIQKDVKQLYELAGKLKKQVEKTDSSEVLSLNMIDTAGEIEKLAKHIKHLARG
jgi:hypothetical protein